MTRAENKFVYVRQVDVAGLEVADPKERFSQKLLDHASGARSCTVSFVRTPPGGRSPAGLHVHDVDQLFYVLGGAMSIEVGGQRMVVGPGSLVVFPALVPHRNWNDGPEPTIHVAVNTPLPDPARPFAREVEIG